MSGPVGRHRYAVRSPLPTFRLVRALAHLAGDIEVVVGTAGAKRLQSIYRQTSSLWTTRSGELAIDMETVFLTFRLAKGYRVSRCMRSDRRYDWQSDPEALRQLEVIRNAKIALGLTSLDSAVRDYRDPELLLIGHFGIHELLHGGSAEEQFENLRVAFDDYLSRKAAAEGIGDLRDRWTQLDPWAPPDIVSIGDTQAAIDGRTVINRLFSGPGPQSTADAVRVLSHQRGRNPARNIPLQACVRAN